MKLRLKLLTLFLTSFLEALREDIISFNI